MKLTPYAAPVLSVTVLALLAILPWGLPAQGRFVLPFLPVAAIFYWSSRHPERLPLWVPFAVGIVVDVLTNGPLGYWPLIYLGSVLLGVEATAAASLRASTQWGAFGLSVAALAVAAWGVASAYDLSLADWRPFAWAAWYATIAYPPIASGLRAFDGGEPLRSSNDRLRRGL